MIEKLLNTLASDGVRVKGVELPWSQYASLALRCDKVAAMSASFKMAHLGREIEVFLSEASEIKFLLEPEATDLERENEELRREVKRLNYILKGRPV
jgi:hypothetical protein